MWDKLVIVAAVIAVFAVFVLFGEAREGVRAYCQPLGYVGGYLDKFDGGGCIARDGSRVSIRILKGQRHDDR